MPICEFCNKEHDGNYGSGRFCSPQCARAFSQGFITEEGRQRQKAPLIDPILRHDQLERRRIKAEENKIAKEKLREERRQIRDNERKRKEMAKQTLSMSKIKSDNVVTALAGITNNADRITKRIAVPDTIKTKQLIGSCGEVTVAKKFIESGIRVFIPTSAQANADLVVLVNDKPYKIQVKSTASYHSNDKRYRSEFSLTHGSYSHEVTEDGHHRVKSQRLQYGDDIDAFVIYDYNLDDAFIFPNNGQTSAARVVSYNKDTSDDPLNMDDLLDHIDKLDEILKE